MLAAQDKFAIERVSLLLYFCCRRSDREFKTFALFMFRTSDTKQHLQEMSGFNNSWDKVEKYYSLSLTMR